SLHAENAFCGGTFFAIHVATSAVKATLVLTALCRYLTLRCPYNRFAGLLINRNNLNVIIWPTVVVLNLPHAFAYKGKAGADEITCAFLYGTDVYTMIIAHVYTIPLLIYALITHLFVKRLDNESDGHPAPNSDFRVLRRGAGHIRTFMLGYVAMLLPMIMLIVYRVGAREALLTVVVYSTVLSFLLTIVEPLCFILIDETFRAELRLQLGLGYSHPDAQQKVIADSQFHDHNSPRQRLGD
ncbi:hypothetical protein BIW11_06715, partial [Tropilaelaps mercedesae]